VIDGKQIWQAILQDEACLKEMPDEGQKEVMRQYIERRLFIVLGDAIDALATPTMVYRVRIAHATAFMCEGWAQRMIEESSKYDIPFIRFLMMHELRIRMMAVFERLIPLQYDIWNWTLLYTSAKADRVHLYDLGVTSQNIEKCLRGEMTIGELFVAQPFVFLKLYGCH
jgi:hypothetical protein